MVMGTAWADEDQVVNLARQGPDPEGDYSQSRDPYEQPDLRNSGRGDVSAQQADAYGNHWDGNQWVSPEGNTMGEDGVWYSPDKTLKYVNGAWVRVEAPAASQRAAAALMDEPKTEGGVRQSDPFALADANLNPNLSRPGVGAEAGNEPGVGAEAGNEPGVGLLTPGVGLLTPGGDFGTYVPPEVIPRTITDIQGQVESEINVTFAGIQSQLESDQQAVIQGLQAQINSGQLDLATAQQIAEDTWQSNLANAQRQVEEALVAGQTRAQELFAELQKTIAREILQDVGHTAFGRIADLLNTDIPYAKGVQNVVGDIGAGVARATDPFGIGSKITQAAGIGSTEDIGRFIGKGYVPTNIGELALYALPGVGVAPGVKSFARDVGEIGLNLAVKNVIGVGTGAAAREVLDELPDAFRAGTEVFTQLPASLGGGTTREFMGLRPRPLGVPAIAGAAPTLEEEIAFLSQKIAAEEATPAIPSRLPSIDGLKPVQQLAEEAEAAGRSSIAAKAGQLPVIRNIIDAINPSALIGAPPKQLVDELGQDGAIKLQADLLAHTRRLDQGNSLVGAIEDGLRNRAREVGFVMKDARVTSVPGAPAVGDLFENPSLYRLTPEQQGLINEVQRILDDANAVEKSAGIKKGEVFSEEGRYFPRLVRESNGVENLRANVKRMVGAKQAFQKERFYQFMEEAIANGVKYESDPAAIVGTRLRASLKAVSDKQVADLLKPFGRTGDPARIGEMGTMVPAVGGQVFPMQTAKRVIDALGTRYPGDIERAIAAVNRIVRPLNAMGDLGYWTLQGLATAFNNPPAFAKMIGTSLDAIIADGRGYGRYISNNSDQIERFTKAGLTLRSSELSLESAATGKLMSKVFGQGPMGRLGMAFDNALNVAALENAKAIAGIDEMVGPGPLRQVMSGMFGNIGGKNSDEVAASIANKMTGRMPTAQLGVSQGQRALEGNLAFAPNYYRAAFGLIGDAMQGGQRGAEGRRAVSLLIGGAAATYYAAATALGQEPNWDYNSSKFMTVKIAGQNVGMGGPIHGFIRSIAEASQNPDDVDDILSMKNPVTRWARGRLSPFVSLAVDIASQQSYMGSFEGTKDVSSFEEIVKHVASRSLPFAVQTALKEGLAPAAAQFVGLRAFPESTSDKATGARANLLKDPKVLAQFPESIRGQVAGLDYWDLGPREQEIVNASLDPKLKAQLDKERGKRDDVFTQARSTVDDYVASQLPQLDSLWDSLMNGKVPASEVKDEVSRIKTKISGVYESNYQTEEYTGAVGKLDKSEIDYWMEKWRSIYDISRASGVMDWAQVDAKQKALIQYMNDNGEKDMANRLLFNVQSTVSAEDHKLLQLYDKAKPTLDAYYATPADQRDEYRKANPQADYILFALGYVGTVRSREAAELAQKNLNGREIKVVK